MVIMQDIIYANGFVRLWQMHKWETILFCLTHSEWKKITRLRSKEGRDGSDEYSIFSTVLTFLHLQFIIFQNVVCWNLYPECLASNNRWDYRRV